MRNFGLSSLVSNRIQDLCPRKEKMKDVSPKSCEINHIVNMYNSFK